jgi:hypothetical protein
LSVSPADNARRHTSGDHIRWQRARDNRAGSDNGSTSDISQDDNVIAYPGARPDVNQPLVTWLIADRSRTDTMSTGAARDVNTRSNEGA